MKKVMKKTIGYLILYSISCFGIFSLSQILLDKPIVEGLVIVTMIATLSVVVTLVVFLAFWLIDD